LEVDTTPIKDLPVDREATADWRLKKQKQQQEKVIESPQTLQKRANVKSLFAKFKLAEVFSDIDRAQREKLFQDTIKFSSKITFTFELLKNLKKEGHRVLVFSMSKKILNILEQIITGGYLGKIKHMRIDGDTEICERENICINFNNNPDIFCGLLTTKVGGQGLNLTGADRAIILDPDWNPANDN